MSKKNLIITVILVVVVIWGLSRWLGSSNNTSTNNNAATAATPILYWGQGCPHCVIVEEFITQNKVEDKFKFVRKEVFNNQENAKEMLTHQAFCDTQGGGMGVPLMWDEKNDPKCMIGDVEVVNYFKKKINAQ